MRWLILILILSLAGCNANQPSNSVAPVANNSVATQSKTIETILALPNNFKPNYKVVEMQD